MRKSWSVLWYVRVQKFSRIIKRTCKLRGNIFPLSGARVLIFADFGDLVSNL